MVFGSATAKDCIVMFFYPIDSHKRMMDHSQSPGKATGGGVQMQDARLINPLQVCHITK
jgi:hypothetical protein